MDPLILDTCGHLGAKFAIYVNNLGELIIIPVSQKQMGKQKNTYARKDKSFQGK